MLQPSQIETVSLRYGAEIADVRSFLRSAGVAVETPAALDDVVQRLGSNRGFHRDLGSHVWMLLYGGSTVPETLAVLVVATLGPNFAATADEDSTHDILRFVMESRSQLSGRSGETTVPTALPATAHEPVADPVPAQDERRAAVFGGEPPIPHDAPVRSPEPLPFTPKETLAAARFEAVHQIGRLRSITPAIGVPDAKADAVEAAMEDIPLPARPELQGAPGERSKLSLMLVAAVCLLLAVAAGWFFLHRSSAAPATVSQTAPVIDGTASSPVEPAPAVAGAPQPEPMEALPAHSSVRKPSASREPHWSAAAPSSRYVQPLSRATATPAPLPSSSQPAPEYRAGSLSPAPIVRVPPSTSSRGNTPVIPSSVAAPKAASGPVPNSVLSTRLGSPVVKEEDAEDDRVAGTKGYPRLLRRKPLDSNGTLVAKVSPVNIPGTRTASIPAGTVRSTSLGISAGNLVYAPDPAYPPDAAIQHISGQVKLEAMVDREGNVASARVISGPPQLRDAAVSAVQQWRYRPYRAGGKPQTFTATAVLDFQLE